MGGPSSGSRSLAQVEVLRALARIFPDPLIELAEIARASLTGPPFDAQLDAWAEKWHLEALREVAEAHVYYWAGTTDAAAPLLLSPPGGPDLVILSDRPHTVIDVEWSPPVAWARPLEQLDPSNPLDPPLADPDHESRDAFIRRARAHYDKLSASLGGHRPRQLRRHAEWFVRKRVQGWTATQIAAAATTAKHTPDVSSVLKGVTEFTRLLSAGRN